MSSSSETIPERCAIASEIATVNNVSRFVFATMLASSRERRRSGVSPSLMRLPIPLTAFRAGVSSGSANAFRCERVSNDIPGRRIRRCRVPSRPTAPKGPRVQGLSVVDDLPVARERST